MKLNFTKMQGCGNDFILLDNLDQSLELSPELVRQMCDRHYGIGADGILTVESSETADLKMRIINSDGTEPEMCGNGIRCFARYVREKWLVDTDEFEVETLAGIICPSITGQEVKVDMGAPGLEGHEIPINLSGKIMNYRANFNEQEYLINCVSMGNPHCIIFLNPSDPSPTRELGPVIETDPLFPNKTNVEFAWVLNPQEIKLEVWERGAGMTLACGTGACATAVAGNLTGRTERDMLVHLPGGDLKISLSDNGRVFMTGPAKFVFQGDYFL